MRNELFRQLVEHEHFPTIAIGSDCLVVDDYVTLGAGTLDEVMERGFSHVWFNASEGNASCSAGCASTTTTSLRRSGCASPGSRSHWRTPAPPARGRPSPHSTHRFLAARLDADLLPCTEKTLDCLIGVDDRRSDPAALMDPSKSVGRAPEAGRLRQLAGDLAALFDARRQDLVATSTPDEWDRARLYRRATVGVLEYHFWLADTAPDRVRRLLSLRESIMAENLLALAEHRPTLAKGHNGRLQRVTSSMSTGDRLAEWPSADMIVSDRLGVDTYC
ncbi:erythromycin esterase family protein [Lentzea flava]|uniref:Uncharacterized protein n=1 Tax=Lentzea flava TaxID=103732 RepID=A0ABQ2VIM2_9PSEU|nr:erythromycin esterase family protein [Lentzea flava]MCP2205360.1 Erythromycin esterase [Lentzea flava]GGU85998.1 hypothetical protein GCM10010178_90130 [Lentzea flava]